MKAWINIFWLGRKELRSVFSDAVMVVLILYSFSLAIYSQATATSESVNNASVAIVDEDNSTLSRAIANALYPPYFKTPEISAWIDGANTTRANTISGYVSGAHINYLSELAANAGVDASAVSKVTLEPRYRYNPTFETIYSIGPKAPAVLLLLFPAILMAVSMAREKEIGTITNFYVTPTKRLEFLIGKQLPYIGIGMVNFVILTLLVVFLLDVPLKGSFWGLALGALLYVFTSTSFGLLVSTLTKSQVAAVFATAILLIMPTINFSGLVQPTSTMEGGGYIIGLLWPATYYMHLSVAAFTKGLGFTDLIGDIIVLSFFGPILIAITAAFLKKQEA